MAAVGNDKKAKWIYAMNIVPMASAEPVDVYAPPSNTTPNPFEASSASAALAGKRSADEMNNGTFFFGDVATGAGRGRGKKQRGPPEGYVCHKCGERTSIAGGWRI